MCPNDSEPATSVNWDDAVINWATWPGPRILLGVTTLPTSTHTHTGTAILINHLIRPYKKHLCLPLHVVWHWRANSSKSQFYLIRRILHPQRFALWPQTAASFTPRMGVPNPRDRWTLHFTQERWNGIFSSWVLKGARPACSHILETETFTQTCSVALKSVLPETPASSTEFLSLRSLLCLHLKWRLVGMKAACRTIFSAGPTLQTDVGNTTK